MGRKTVFVSVVMVLLVCIAVGSGPASAKKAREFTTDFNMGACTFSTTGRNPYFILDPGYQLVLEGVEDGEEIELHVTVLPDLEKITLPVIGEVMTRVVEERELEGGSLVEVSRNFFARCEENNNVFYFGEEVDIIEDGQIVGHEGEWRAGVNGAAPGVIMPGTFLIGSRYFQEIAPGVAMDRAENMKMGLTVTVPAGTYLNAVQVRETSPLSKSAKDIKIYAPGIGLIVDEAAKLVSVYDPSN